MIRRWYEEGYFLVAAIILLAAVAVAFAACVDIQAANECADRGGHIVQVPTGKTRLNCYSYSRYYTDCEPEDITVSECRGPDGKPR